MRKRNYDGYVSGDPSPETLASLVHEHTHIKRLGPGLGIMVKYWTNKDFRLQEELAAITEEMRVLKKHSNQFDIGRRAKDLSSIAYL